MRTTFGFVLTTAALVAATSATAPHRVQAQAPALLYPASDAVKDIDAALAAARKDGKHVLLDFGADWCPDCRVLGHLFEDAAVAPFAAGSFHVVHVDIGRRDKNAEVVAKYHATSGDWIPAVVVLDASGTTQGITDDKVRLTRRTTPEELLTLLQTWAPKKSGVELASFTERGVRVRVTLDADPGGGLWLSGAFVPTDPETHLYGTDLPIGGIDGLGRPTRLTVSSTSGLTPRGIATADRPTENDRIEALNATLSIYPAGPVTLRMPVEIADRHVASHAVLSITYMGCSPRGCLPPVIDKRIAVVVPGTKP